MNIQPQDTSTHVVCGAKVTPLEYVYLFIYLFGYEHLIQRLQFFYVQQMQEKCGKD